MNINQLKKTIPNPFDEDSTLSEFANETLLLKRDLSLARFLRSILVSIIFLVILIAFIKIPSPIIIYFVVVEISAISVSGYIRLKELSAINSLNTVENANDYVNLLITDEYWELIKSTIGIILDFIRLYLLLLVFSTEITDLLAQRISSNLLNYAIYILVVSRLFVVVYKVVKYNLIKKLHKRVGFASVSQGYTIIEKKLEFAKILPGIYLFVLFYFLLGMPHSIVLIFAGVVLFVAILSMIELNRIMGVNLDSEEIDPSTIKHKIEYYQNEQIEGAIFGILMTAVDMKQVFKPSGLSILGSGKSYHPENTLLLTNHRLIFIQVPVSGGNKIVGEINYVQSNFFYNRGEIRQKGEEILKTNSLEQILKLAINDVLYDDIVRLTLEQTKIVIEKTSGEKLGYVFMDREFIEPLQKILTFYLKDKFELI